MLEEFNDKVYQEGVLKLKKIIRVLLVVLLINLFSSFTYAGLDDFPRPTSTEPVFTVEGTTIN